MSKFKLDNRTLQLLNAQVNLSETFNHTLRSTPLREALAFRLKVERSKSDTLFTVELGIRAYKADEEMLRPQDEPNANPCFGVRRNKETPRDYYAGETVWDAVYAQAVQELKDAMDLAYLTGQRPADVLKIAATDLNSGFLMVGQGKTEKRLRIRLEDAGAQSGLSTFIDDLQERRALNGIKTSTLITNTSGLRMSQQMLRNRWDEAREKAAVKASADGDTALAISIRQFQFKDIRSKAASEIELTHASRLLGHSTEEMTKKVYRRVGEIVKPTK
ncbi:integrase [Pseudomonas fluorescens HK44]|uniref:Integrase n=1 Tax=Pseudomonas fluorescens HK44 TaxID=1042209 RepID=A0A010TFA9_PSEFL|nr:tyrosine-type recombinase/integrase [Pseudomonas fluorescens]EXF95817.1 integrase [Pseudomonas fluorescens HK44]